MVQSLWDLKGDATVTEGSTTETGSGDDTRPLIQAFLEGQVPNAPVSVGIAFMPLAKQLMRMDD